jgi:uncharacterized protein YciI
MLQFVIIAEDGTDDQALQRRMAVRPDHFEGARKLKAENHFLLGGAILNAEGKMSGSVMIVQFETEEALQEWLSKEPYITGNVWQKITVKPFKVADV